MARLQNPPAAISSYLCVLLHWCCTCLRTFPYARQHFLDVGPPAWGRPTIAVKTNTRTPYSEGSLHSAEPCLVHGQPGKATRVAIREASRLSLGDPLQLTSSSGMYSSWQQQSVQKTPPQYRQWVRPLLVMSRKLPSKRFGQSGHSATSSSWTHLLLGVRASRAAAMV